MTCICRLSEFLYCYFTIIYIYLQVHIVGNMRFRSYFEENLKVGLMLEMETYGKFIIYISEYINLAHLFNLNLS